MFGHAAAYPFNEVAHRFTSLSPDKFIDGEVLNCRFDDVVTRRKLHIDVAYGVGNVSNVGFESINQEET